MIPTQDELLDISRSREGTLKEVPFAVLLHALALHERTVVLEVRHNQLVKKIVLEYGIPVDCRSNLLHETLGRFLVAQGKLAEEQYAATLAQFTAKGVPLGEVLVEQGILSPGELFRLLQMNLAKKLLDCFSWREGQYRMLFDVPKVESPLKVNAAQLVVTGVSRFARKDEVDAAVGALVGKKLGLHPSPPFPLADLRLSPTQARLAEALKKGARIDELAAATGVPFDEITRLLYALALIGIAVPAEQIPRSEVPKAPEAPPKAQPPPQPPESRACEVSPAEVERRTNEVMQAYLSYRRQDPFDLLGLPEDASLPAIREAFLLFSRRYAPWSFEGTGLAPLADKAKDLFLAGAAAFAELGDYDRKMALLSKRRAQREEKARAPAGAAFAIKTDLLDPESHYKKALPLIQEKKWQEALRLLEFASDCDPQNGVYRSEVALCRFRHSPLLAKQAIRELAEALRLDPKCAQAAYYSGLIHQETGEKAEAEAMFKRASVLAPKDPRPAKALSALGSKERR